MKKLHSNPYSKQQGAILSISLVILFLLSILGLAVMRTSILEEKMSANGLHHDVAFQAAETVAQDSINNTDNMTDALNSSTGTVEVPFSNPIMPMVEATTKFSYVGKGYAPGFSTSGFNVYRFLVDSTGSINEANTSTRIIQGVFRPAPATSE